MTDARWFIQKPIRHNCPVGQSGPLNQQGAVYQSLEPTVSLFEHEWIAVVKASALEAERARSAKLFHLLQSIERRARTASMGSSFVDLMEVAEWAADALAEYEATRD